MFERLELVVSVVSITVHPVDPDFWCHEPPRSGVCWVCGRATCWIYLDLGYQHVDCDAYPTEDGDVVVVEGVARRADV